MNWGLTPNSPAIPTLVAHGTGLRHNTQEARTIRSPLHLLGIPTSKFFVTNDCTHLLQCRVFALSTAYSSQQQETNTLITLQIYVHFSWLRTWLLLILSP